jgi:hypothetical protein
MTTTQQAQQAQQSVPWWGWVAAVGMVLWAAESPTWRPVVIAALFAFILVNFDRSIKP